jgi:transcriptional regulator with XRE-family HTH domain
MGYGFSREAFREVREDAGLTIDDVARRVGLSRSRIGEVERGLMDPTEDQIEALAAALGVDAWVLHWQ